MSTTRLGCALPDNTPPAPNSTSFRSSVVETMVNTVAQWAIAALSVTTSAPIAANGSALTAVRFHTERPWPALIRRAAMASPMRPRPIQPTACDALLLMRQNLVNQMGRSLGGDSGAVEVRDLRRTARAIFGGPPWKTQGAPVSADCQVIVLFNVLQPKAEQA